MHEDRLVSADFKSDLRNVPFLYPGWQRKWLPFGESRVLAAHGRFVAGANNNIGSG